MQPIRLELSGIVTEANLNRHAPFLEQPQTIFETIYKDSHASFLLRSTRFLCPDVAVAFARAHIKFKEGNEARELETRPTLILVKEQDGWQIAAFQNTKISKVPAAAQAAARLPS